MDIKNLFIKMLVSSLWRIDEHNMPLYCNLFFLFSFFPSSHIMMMEVLQVKSNNFVACLDAGIIMSTSYISTILLASVVLLLYLSSDEQKQMIAGSQILLEKEEANYSPWA